MSFIDCIKSQLRESDKKGDKQLQARRDTKMKEVIERYNNLVEYNAAQGLPEEAAQASAARQTLLEIEHETSVRRKQTLRTIQVKRQIDKNLREFRNAAGEEDYGEAAISLLEKTDLSKYSAFNLRKERVLGTAHRLMEDVLNKFQPKAAGFVKPTAGLDNLARELFGEGTGDQSAKELADAAGQAMEYLRKRANRAGAEIPKRDNFGMPQTHDRIKVARVGKQEWVKFVSGKLDWQKMQDPNTGQIIPAVERQKVLEDVYDTIKTQGYVKIKPTANGGRSAANKLGNHRFLEFRNADSFLEYHEQFGEGSVYDVIVNHTDYMAREIAMMEILGPNPASMKEYVKNVARRWAGETDAKDPESPKKLHSQSIEKQLRKFDEVYALVKRTDKGLQGDIFGHSLAGIRNILTSSFLGSASLLALPGDMMTTALTKRFNGHPGAVSLKRYLRLMNPADSADRRLAVRLGLVAESATAIAYGQQRFHNQITGPNLTQRMADSVLRLSLLTPHTQAARWAFGMEMMGALADNVKKPFKDLDTPFRNMMSRYGISAEDWDVMRKTNLYEEDGATFLRPDDMLDRVETLGSRAEDLADKFMEMIAGETNFAVPNSSLRGRTFLVGETNPGTFIGEVARSLAMFKNFPVTIMLTHGRRALLQNSTRGKLAYAASFGIGLTMAGALGVQLRQISQGKDPMNMNPANPEGRKFWAQSALAGGGMGIWGDFLFQDINRYGGGLSETVSGPVFQMLDDTRKLTFGNLVDLAENKDTNFPAEVVTMARRYMPGGSIWYMRLALQRMIWDQLQAEVDPKAARRWSRMERNLLRNNNQKFFWRPGDTAPDRAPDLGQAVQ